MESVQIGVRMRIAAAFLLLSCGSRTSLTPWDASTPKVASSSDAGPDGQHDARPSDDAGVRVDACANPCTGTCMAGGCVTTLVAIQGQGPSQLLVDDDGVYWVDQSTEASPLMRVPPVAGAPVTLNAGPVGLIALQSGHLFWWTTAPPGDGGTAERSAILSLSTAGGAPVEVAHSSVSIAGLATDATNLYWIGGDANVYPGPGAAVSAPLAGGAQSTLSVGPSSLLGAGGSGWPIVATPAGLYWVVDIDSPTYPIIISTPPLTGGPPDARSFPCFGTDLVADETNLYWTDPDGAGHGSVVEMPLTGSVPATLVTEQHGIGHSLAIDATSLYWTERSGHIVEMAIAGGTPVTLAKEQDHPDTIAVHGDSVYWTAESPNDYGAFTDVAIMRLAPTCGCP